MDKEKNTSLTETSPSDENKIILLRIEESESVDRETLIKKLVIDESLEKCSLLGISKMDQPRNNYSICFYRRKHKERVAFCRHFLSFTSSWPY